jgi:hypothetical protein
MTMKSNADKMLEPPYDVNPVSKLWQKLGSNGFLLSKLSEFMCLAEIAITTILGSVKDERTFSSLKFIKSKLRNRLEGNLDIVVSVFSQGYYDLESLPYADAYKHWRAAKERQGVHE